MLGDMNVSPMEELARRVEARQELPSPPVRRALRKAAGVSLGDVASAIGVTRQAVGLWEAGARTPRGANLDLYVEVLRTFRRAA